MLIIQIDEIKQAEPKAGSQAASRNKIRVYDKRLSCLYCGQLYKHRITQHLRIMHSNEKEVAQADAKQNEEEKKLGFARIKNLGNYKHNLNVLSSGKGELVLSRRPSGQLDPKEYLPCVHCFGFFKSRDLWKHTLRCPLKPSGQLEKGKQVNIQAKSRILLSASLQTDDTDLQSIKINVLEEMRKKDDVYQALCHDKLIVRLGSILYNKLGPRRKNDIAQRMRQLGRLNIACNCEQLFDLLNGKGFDRIITGVLNLVIPTDSEEGIKTFEKPALALRLGHNLVKCAQIKLGMCLREDDDQGYREADTFLKLHSAEWTDKIASIALATLKTNKFQKPDILPITEDLVKFREFLLSKMESLIPQLESNNMYNEWRELCEVMMCSVLLFNKRRGSEAAKLLITSYRTRPNWAEIGNQEIIQSLPALQRKLLQDKR